MRTWTPLRETRRRISVTLHVLAQTLSRDDTLLAGPYCGELGWELMEWSGYVRRLSTRYHRTIVISYEGHSCLYDHCDYYSHDRMLQDSGYWYGSQPQPAIEAMVAHYRQRLGLTSFDWLHPTHLNRYTRQLLGPQVFWDPFDRDRTDCRYDVGFHFRSIHRADLDTKNYPPDYAADLVSRCQTAGMQVCCIGHPQYSLRPPNCDDLRSADLSMTRTALRTITRATSAASPSTWRAATQCVVRMTRFVPRSLPSQARRMCSASRCSR
jgi:hypothetical protein